MTAIQWTDRTWNPIRGCTRVSEGCRNCYAETLAARNLPGMRSPTTGKPFALRTPAGPRWTGAVELIPGKLSEPVRWRKPQRIFVNSMSDLFHEALRDEDIAAVYSAMAFAPWHTFQVLTKRPERRLRWMEWAAQRGEGLGVGGSRIAGKPADPWPLRNVWEGTSIEDQATAEERIPQLLGTPAALRFLSVEPLLEEVNLYLGRDSLDRWSAAPPIDWVIVGGESGPGARPLNLEWVRSVIRQCREASVPVFVKQLGARPYDGYLTAKEIVEGGKGRPRPADQPLTEEAAAEILGPDFSDVPLIRPVHLADRKGGDMAEWRPDLRVREFPR